MSRPAIDINRLNTEERLELIEDLWESLISDPSSIPVTDAQKQMLDQRLAELDSRDVAGIPWEEVKAQIQKKLP